MVRHFARLKYTLIRNGLRSTQYAVLFTVGAIGSAALALVGFAFFAGLRSEPFRYDAVIVMWGAVTLVWTVVPLLGFGTDETLDPQRLALLPLRRGQLLSGLLVAAVVGVAPIATALGMSGTIVGLSHDALQALVILLALTATLLMCIVASRALISLLAPLLRSRRGRDMLLMGVMLAVLVPSAFRLFASNAGSQDPNVVFHEIATRVRYTPFGWGGLAASEAAQGHLAAALLVILAIGAVSAGCLWIWAIAIPRAMTATDITPGTNTDGAHHHRTTLFPRALAFLPRNRTGAIAAKEMRYYFRDPRRRGPVIAALIVPALFLFTSLRDARARPGYATLLALIALLPASGLTLNQFGLDGAALWSTIMAGVDARADLIGKNIATTLLVCPLVALPTVAAASVTGGWSYIPLTLGLAPGMLGVILAIGNLISVRAPYAVPDRKNPLASNPGQGCIGGLGAIASLMVDAALLVPAIVVTSLVLVRLPLGPATVVAIVFTTAYGGAIWWAGTGLAARFVAPRMPEVLDAVSTRHAG